MHAALSGGAGIADWGSRGPAVEVRECDKNLCTGCRTGNIEMVKKALDNGANPSVQLRLALGEITPIFICAMKGHREIAEELIKRTPQIIFDNMGFDGTSCLHHAASNDQPGMCELLIESGCSVNQRDKLGRTPLMDAAEIGSVRVITVLMDNGANANLEDKETHAALSYCLDFISKEEPKFFDACVTLIRCGSNANYVGKFTLRTMLHYAAAQGNLELVKQLIEEHQAFHNLEDEQGKTPLDYAMENKNAQEVVEYLQQAAPSGASCGCIIL